MPPYTHTPRPELSGVSNTSFPVKKSRDYLYLYISTRNPAYVECSSLTTKQTNGRDIALPTKGQRSTFNSVSSLSLVSLIQKARLWLDRSKVKPSILGVRHPFSCHPGKKDVNCQLRKQTTLATSLRYEHCATSTTQELEGERGNPPSPPHLLSSSPSHLATSTCGQ